MSELPYCTVRLEQPQFTSSQVQFYIVIHLRLLNIDLFYTKSECPTFNYQKKDRQCKMRNKLNKFYYLQFLRISLMYYFCLIYTSIALFNENLFLYGCNEDSKDTLILQFLLQYYLYERLFFVTVDLIMLRIVIKF